MDELYKRPDRAAIAARVLAEQAALGERTGGGCAEPDTGPDPPAAGEPVPVLEHPATPAPVKRCRRCGYLTNTTGHWWTCHG